MASRELDKVLTVISAVSAIEEAASYGPIALRALSAVISFELGSFNEVDTEASRAFFCAYPDDTVEQDLISDFPRLVQQNPILQYQRRTSDGSAHRISDFVSSEELHRLELYERVYAPRGIEFQVALALAAKSPQVVAFALNRTDSDFSDDELVLLNMLRPHLLQAWRNVQALAALRGIDGALAEAGKAMIVLGDRGEKIYSPEWADRALIEHFGPATSEGFPAPMEGWIEEERRPFFLDGQVRIQRPLVSVVGDRQLIARFIRGSQERPSVVVMEEKSLERGSAELRRLGLTQREAEILLLLTQGNSTGTIARQLDVRPATVSKHLEHIFHKLGVTSRTAAAAAASDALYSSR